MTEEQLAAIRFAQQTLEYLAEEDDSVDGWVEDAAVTALESLNKAFGLR